MILLGLTGGIGMGKSTAANMFAALGVPAFNADDAVRALQAPGGAAIPALAAAFAGVVQAGVLDRAALRALVLADDAALRRLEGIMHPLVHGVEDAFLAAARRDGQRAVLLDIPLLFETKGESRVDKTILVSCPAQTQMQRVLARGLGREQAEAIIARQMPDADKRARADYVIDTGGTLADTQAQVMHLCEELGL